MNQLEDSFIGKVTHQGKWKVYDEFDIDCYVTDNGIRLLSLRGTARALDIKGNGSGGVLRNLQLKWIQPYLSDQLKEWILWATNEKIKPIKGTNLRMGFFPYVVYNFLKLLIGSPRNHF